MKVNNSASKCLLARKFFLLLSLLTVEFPWGIHNRFSFLKNDQGINILLGKRGLKPPVFSNDWISVNKVKKKLDKEKNSKFTTFFQSAIAAFIGNLSIFLIFCILCVWERKPCQISSSAQWKNPLSSIKQLQQKQLGGCKKLLTSSGDKSWYNYC